MINKQPYSTSFDNDTERAAIIAAKESARKQAEERKKSRKIFDYYSRRNPSNKQVLK